MSGLTPTQYIEHHLRHLELNLKTMHIGSGGGFWTLNLDTLIVSVVLGVLFLWGFRAAARRASAATPRGWQNFVEIAIEKIDGTVAETFHGNRHMVAPLALTIFIWVFLMNFMDLIPVDLIPWGLNMAGVHHFKVVPTADPTLTFAMSLSVFVICIFFNFKSKGGVGLLKEVLSRPFGWWCLPINVIFRLIEEIAKPVSLSLRLFGNLFAGELIFVLIALLPWWLLVPLGFVWTLFHVLIILIQAFIFMMLTVVYIMMANDSH
jgi:F-type H+-transporting ATPase subunit a